MKIFLLILTILITNTKGFSQRHSIDFGARIGTAVSKPKLLDEDNEVIIDKHKMNNIYDKGIYLNYSFNFWKKADLHISTGLDFSETKHNIGLYGKHKNILLENITLKKKRVGFYLGLYKNFIFKKHQKFSIKIGAYLYFKNYYYNEKDYTKAIQFNTERSISYKYEIKTYHEFYKYNTRTSNTFKYRSSRFNSSLNYKINSLISINLGVDLITYVDFFYDVKSEVKYFSNNSSTPYLVEIRKPLIKRKIHIIDDFIHFTTGITFIF